MNSIKVRVLEFNKGEYEGNAYSNILARYNEKVLKFKLDPKCGDLSKLLDKEVELELSIVKGANSLASLKVIAVSVLK